MARPLRIEFPGAWYHVMNRGANHQPTFLDHGDYINFLSVMEDSLRMWALECHAYCLMSNHYHLLVHTPRGNLSRAMRHLDGIYTQRFNKFHQRDGPLMRGRYKAILIDAESYLLQVARYIHLNPVEAALVEKPEQYPWSSFRFYLQPQRSAPGLLRKELLERFGPADHAVQRLCLFTQAGIDEEAEKSLENRNS